MNDLIYNFINPYIKFLYGASYNLYQTLEGLGLVSSNFLVRDAAGNIVNSYWSPDQAMIPVFGTLIIYIFFLVPILILAAYTLGKAKGFLIFIFIFFLPGTLNCIGFFPDINYVPDRFVIEGTGALGNGTGYAPLLIISALSGWAVIVLLYDNLNLNENFRQYYDHLWFPTALIAAVFFVSDNSANEKLTEFNEAKSEVRSASSYLLKQVRKYQEYCSENRLESLKSCKWSSSVQWNLSNISESIVSLNFLNKTTDLYINPREGLFEKDISEIRKEISVYNQALCPVRDIGPGLKKVAPLSNTCEYPPSAFCRAFPDELGGIVSKDIIGLPVALASECIIPTLIADKHYLDKLSSAVDEHKRAKHYRWLYFIAIAAVVGGKIANSSSKIAGLDAKDPSSRRVLLRLLFKVLMGLYIFICKLPGLLRDFTKEKSNYN